jgi:preprotein translocase subunit SecY
MSSTQFLKFLTDKKSNNTEHEMRIKEKKIQKFLGLLLCLLQASAYVLSGMYGKLDTVGPGNATIIVIQVTINCSIVTLNCNDVMRKY